jgi:energy-coupling factor transporter ATP-binding protein EcfA2
VLSAKGWRIAKNPPPGCRLIRGQGTLPLPEPIRPGRDGARRAIAELNELWPGIRGDRLIILLATMAWCLVSRRDHVAILVHGEYGAGKSSLARLIRGVLDPNRQPYQPLPTVDAGRNLLIAGLHQRLVTVDNTSEEAFTRDIADGLCLRLDGYGGARFRSLQTNADLTVIPSSGPLLMTAITPLTRYPDLADRAVVVDAREIRAPRLINPSQLDERVAQLIPALLGVLLEAAVAGLARAADYGVVEGWRNARFAAFAQAAARALGEPPAAMAACLADMGTYQRTLVASMAPVAAALIDLAGQEPEETETASLLPTGCVWRGRMTDLLAELAKNPALRMDSAFPRNPAALMGEILRLRPVLDTAGVRVAFRRAERRGKSPVGVARWVELWTDPELPDQAREGDEPHPEPMPAVRH